MKAIQSPRLVELLKSESGARELSKALAKTTTAEGPREIVVQGDATFRTFTLRVRPKRKAA